VNATSLTGISLDAARGVPAKASSSAPGGAVCAHCGEPLASAADADLATAQGRRFCCPGCAAAYATIQSLGLGRYYTQRVLDATRRPLRPEPAERFDLARYIRPGANGVQTLELAVDGLQCGACVWLIESVLAREPELVSGRVNMTTRRLRLVWRGEAETAERLVGRIEHLGYRLVPFNQACLAATSENASRTLLRALAVAGFAAGNVMLLAFGVWVGFAQHMGPATRVLMDWLSALIALPAVAYAGMPFFRSAASALRAGRTNMDVPISLGVLVVVGQSFVETLHGGAHTYFESAVMLLFFLLLGRVLDQRVRQEARATAEHLLALRTSEVTLLQPDGTMRRVPQESLPPGSLIFVAPGERIGADGVVEQGASSVDASLVTGEALPQSVGVGSNVFAGTVNLEAPLRVRVKAAGSSTLLAECVRLIEAAENARGRFVILADRVARHYAPAVHGLALITLGVWWLGLQAPFGQSLLIAASVLIITCPCALALAVPAVQVIATGRLFRQGILLKSPTALERLAEVDTVVFDKTGTLTEPNFMLASVPDPEAFRLACSLAGISRHPLARALLAASGPVPPALGAIEHPGSGIAWAGPEGEVRLGSRSFCGLTGSDLVGGEESSDTPELWLCCPNHKPVRFAFVEQLRPEAAETVHNLAAKGLAVELASGDRAESVRAVAAALGIGSAHAGITPVEKIALVKTLQQAGHRVLMVGDGLNDGPSLAAADISASPASATEIAQNVADLVFQGRSLRPIAEVVDLARRARAVMRQNLGIALFYNAAMVPLAMAGYVTPWLAAAAMSASSLAVMLNSLRLQRGIGR